MITIGSDPEFGLIHQNGRQAMARDFLTDSTSAEIGVDGHSDIGEIRPRHGKTPREHLTNIANLMVKVGRTVPHDIKITAGSMVGEDPIGGHIHFGISGRSSFSIAQAARALDYFLALPVALIEVQSSAKTRRVGSSYGSLCSWREQKHGFEYRTLPSWLLGWGVALSILSVGYAVVDAVRQKACPDVPKDIPNPQSFNNCNKKVLRPLMKQIRKGWRKLPLYPEFRLEIAFLNHLLVRGMEWKEGQDVRHNWYPARDKRRHQVLGNQRDGGCPQIAYLVEGIKGTSVFIYGLSPERDADIAINDLDMVSGLDIDYLVSGTAFGVAHEYDGWLCIGLSLKLRQDVQAAADLVNKILRGG